MNSNTKFTIKPTSIVFPGDSDTPVLKLEPNGDIYVNGKLVENDKEVVDGLRKFLKI